MYFWIKNKNKKPFDCGLFACGISGTYQIQIEQVSAKFLRNYSYKETMSLAVKARDFSTCKTYNQWEVV